MSKIREWKDVGSGCGDGLDSGWGVAVREPGRRATEDSCEY